MKPEGFCKSCLLLAITSVLLLIMAEPAFAQKLEHLQPVQITDISLVKRDTTPLQNAYQRLICPEIDTNFIFYECRNHTDIVGYLLNYRTNRHYVGYISIWGKDTIMSDGTSMSAGLSEVQHAELLLAKELDLRADSAQRIERALTAPRFYQYIRQYIFYVEADGDTCVHVNFVMPDTFEINCLNSTYLRVCDGDDDYWQATLNLSKNQILDFYINGPTIVFMKGRSQEPRGLHYQCVFRNGRWVREEIIPFSKLPQKVQNQVDSPQDTTLIYKCTRHKGRYYYTIFADGIQRSYKTNGKWMFIGPEDLYSGSLSTESLQHVPHIKQMLSYIYDDMSRRGRDFKHYGKLKSVEVAKNHYVIHVGYRPNINYYIMRAAYTFNRNGDFVGIDID